MTVLDRAHVAVNLGADCVADGCLRFASETHSQLSSGRYTWPVSILRIDDMESYTAEHRTARKRAARAQRLGYRFAQVSRADHIDDIHAINTSKPERQGRPMTEGYRRRHEYTPLPDYPCVRHRIDEYGVLTGPRLVAYLVLHVCGELALVSQILGHGDHEKNSVMYLLAVGAFGETLARSGPVTAFYNRHDSGTDGLRFFKERLGFQPAHVDWCK